MKNNKYHNNNSNPSTIISHYNITKINLKKSINGFRGKSSPFECGFDQKISKRLPFSSRCFLIAVIFMIFYVEIALLLPMPFTMLMSNIKSWMIGSSVFLLILIIGLYHEWNQGSLE